MADGLQRAEIKWEDGCGKTVVCHFNPADLAITRKIKWTEIKDKGPNAPRKVFAGGETTDLTIKLLFDVSDSDSADVRDNYKELFKMVAIEPKRALVKVDQDRSPSNNPPRCQFVWSSSLFFTATIRKIKQTLTKFRVDGTPVRAKVDVTFEQLEAEVAGRRNLANNGNLGERPSSMYSIVKEIVFNSRLGVWYGGETETSEGDNFQSDQG